MTDEGATPGWQQRLREKVEAAGIEPAKRSADRLTLLLGSAIRDRGANRSAEQEDRDFFAQLLHWPRESGGVPSDQARRPTTGKLKALLPAAFAARTQ